MSHGGSHKKVSNTLLALSSAAIFAVYTAGYSRTQSAANRFAAADGRRPAFPVARDAVRPPASEVVTSRSAPVPSDLRREVRNERSSERSPVKTEVAKSSAAPAPVETPVAAPPAPAEPAPVVADQKVAEQKAPEEKASEQKPEPKVEAAAVAPPAAPPAPAAPATPPHPVWKDGTYTGWGYSRHGDIQASVVIEGGRITSSTIAQCNTRYSCSVINDLIPQPVKRQSPDVDNVSGATQSADAYYFAVTEALAKAK